MISTDKIVRKYGQVDIYTRCFLCVRLQRFLCYHEFPLYPCHLRKILHCELKYHQVYCYFKIYDPEARGAKIKILLVGKTVPEKQFYSCRPYFPCLLTNKLHLNTKFGVSRSGRGKDYIPRQSYFGLLRVRNN